MSSAKNGENHAESSNEINRFGSTFFREGEQEQATDIASDEINHLFSVADKERAWIGKQRKILRQHLFLEAIQGHTRDTSEFARTANELGIDIKRAYYSVVVLQASNLELELRSIGLNQSDLASRLQNAVSKGCGIINFFLHEIPGDGMTCILYCSDRHQLEETMVFLKSNARQIMIY